MIKLNIHEAKTYLSRYLENLKDGETILLCKRNKPIAEIRPLPNPPQGKRPIGLAKGLLAIPNECFAQIPEESIQTVNDAS